VEATYRPAGWCETTVRAAWSPAEDQAFDLEIEVSTRSVGELRAFEVIAMSDLSDPAPPKAASTVHPRDARSAGLTYDGRQPDLSALVTEPPGSFAEVAPQMRPLSFCAGWRFAAFAHPDDVSRRITDDRGAIRDALFGYDLERGVVLRGRLRAVWLTGANVDDALDEQWRRFLARPLPLAT